MSMRVEMQKSMANIVHEEVTITSVMEIVDLTAITDPSKILHVMVPLIPS